LNRPIREGFVEPRSPPSPEPPQLEAPPADDPLPAEVWPIRINLLHKPTRNNKNEMIKELVLREPTGGDINRYGNPVRINQDGDVIIDERKMTFMISALSGVLLPFIEALDPRDWNSCAYRIRGFFLPEPAAWEERT
jgi:Phage tail assembly chaperone proteins, E, or 41 or 14